MSSKTIFSILGGLLAYQAVALPAPQALDFDVIDALPPAPTPTIATGVLSQAVAVNTASILASIVQDIATSTPTSSSYNDYNDYNDYDVRSYQKIRKVKRAACGPMPASSYTYKTSPDTASDFLSDATYSNAALSATTPDGWTQTFSNLNGSTSAYYYLGYSTLSSYDVAACANKCTNKTLCQSFNIYFERSPANSIASNCTDSASQTLLKCVLWGGPITTESAYNRGQFQGQFRVVIAGSNAYTKTNYFATTPSSGYDITSLGQVSINAPLDCNGNTTYMGVRMFNTGPFDPSLCAAACTATSAFDIASGVPSASNPDICRFYVTYQLLKNGLPFAQACAMYTQTWNATYAVNSGNYDGAGNKYTIASSYMASNVTDGGVCAVVAPVVSVVV